MTFHQRMFHLLDALKIDQKDFAAYIGASAQIVSKWKTSTLKSYTKYAGEIADYFGVTSDYFWGKGVFKNWDMIMHYPSEVFDAMREHIPCDFFDISVDEDFFLLAWLDKHMCYGITGPYELDLIRWFHSNVEQVEFGTDGDDSVSWVTVSFKASAPFLPQNTKGQIAVDNLPDDALNIAVAYTKATKKEREIVQTTLSDYLQVRVAPRAAAARGDIDLSKEDISGVTFTGEDPEHL